MGGDQVIANENRIPKFKKQIIRRHFFPLAVYYSCQAKIMLTKIGTLFKKQTHWFSIDNTFSILQWCAFSEVQNLVK